jgi:hypothetical protein
VNQCDKCKVSVHPQHENCPLCGHRLGEPVSSDTSYPCYGTAEHNAGFTRERLLLFLMITASAITIFINIFTYDKAASPWSVVVTLSLVFSWRVIHIMQTKRANAGRKIINGYLIVSAFLVALDLFSGFLKWSTTYVIPFLTIFIALVFTILAVRGSKYLNEYLGNLLAIFFISLCPVIIYLFSLSTQAWASMVAILYCLLTVVGLLLFMGKDFRKEIKKRFHY